MVAYLLRWRWLDGAGDCGRVRIVDVDKAERARGGPMGGEFGDLGAAAERPGAALASTKGWSGEHSRLSGEHRSVMASRLADRFVRSVATRAAAPKRSVSRVGAGIDRAAGAAITGK